MTKPKPAKPAPETATTPPPSQGTQAQPQGGESPNPHSGQNSHANDGAGAGNEVPPESTEPMETDKSDTAPGAA